MITDRSGHVGLTGSLAEWAVDCRGAMIPQDVRSAGSRHLLDALGCALAGVRTGQAGPVLRTATLDGPGPCRIPGAGTGVSAPAAAMAMGASIHALDFDDTHADGLVHASAPIVAAALAAVQAPDRSTDAAARFFDAIVVGLETICRLGAAVPHGFHARGFHATSVCGTPAAALSAAVLLGADAATAATAMGIAVSFAGGSLEFLSGGASTKQLHPGWAAAAGLQAARLALAGASAPAAALEGGRGLFALHTGARVDPDAVTDGLGSRWEANRITIKPYPACQLSHAAIDTAADLRDRIDLDRVDHVVVTIDPRSADVVALPAGRKQRPQSPYEAKFSVQWSVAAMLVDGNLGIDSFTDESIARSDILDLAAKITVETAESMRPAADSPAQIDVTDASGNHTLAAVERSAGGPDRPLGSAALHRKLSQNVGSAERADALRVAVDGLAAGDASATCEHDAAPAVDQLLDVLTQSDTTNGS